MFQLPTTDLRRWKRLELLNTMSYFLISQCQVLLIHSHHSVISLSNAGMSGFDVVNAIKSDSQKYGTIGKDMYIIAVTANAMKGDCEACIQAGMNDYLSKPFSIAQLKQALEKAVIGLG